MKDDPVLSYAHLNHTYIHDTIRTLMPGWIDSGWMSILLYLPRETKRKR